MSQEAVKLTCQLVKNFVLTMVQIESGVRLIMCWCFNAGQCPEHTHNTNIPYMSLYKMTFKP